MNILNGSAASALMNKFKELFESADNANPYEENSPEWYGWEIETVYGTADDDDQDAVDTIINKYLPGFEDSEHSLFDQVVDLAKRKADKVKGMFDELCKIPLNDEEE